MSDKNRIKKLFDRASIEPSDTHPASPKSPPVEKPDEQAAAAPDSPESHQELSASSGDENPSTTAETNPEITESVPTVSPDDATPLEPASPEEPEAVHEAEMPMPPAPAQQTSNEDILDDVRRSLIEEEIDKNQKESRWWRRFGRKGKKPEPEQAPAPVEIDVPATQDPGVIVTADVPEAQAEEEIDQIEDLIEMLENESQAASAEPVAAAHAEPAAEPEPEIDFDELKKQAFQPRPVDEASEVISDVRSIALEDGEEVLVEVETKSVDPMQERMNALENAFKPYRRYIYMTLALLGAAMAVTAALILFNVYQQTRPQPVQPASNLPYPTAVSLPGGWSFQLAKGALQNGRWEPQGAEWLQGTEVCRWVALPWSTQLEAVIRTLNPKDPIELTMSNNDKLVYEVYSIRQLTPDQMNELDSNSPCLLLILTESESEQRWVLTALP